MSLSADRLTGASMPTQLMGQPSLAPKENATVTTVGKQDTVTISNPASIRPPLVVRDVASLTHSGYLISGPQLQAAMAKAHQFHYGEVPTELQSALGQSDADIWKSINHLGKTMYGNRLTRGESKTVTLKKGGQATLDYLGEGMHGVVYKLTAGDQSYAFKVFHPATAGTGIPFNEVANGAFLTSHGVSDASKLFMANPDKNWTMMEYIPHDANLAERSGPSMAELGITLSDEGTKNRINGILIDHGGTLKAPRQFRLSDNRMAYILSKIQAPNLLKRFL